MTETITRPDVDNLEDVDFEPVCCIACVGLGLKEKCERPAAWVGYAPCCGVAALVCEHHFQVRYERPFICSRCNGLKGVHNDLIGWHRL